MASVLNELSSTLSIRPWIEGEDTVLLSDAWHGKRFTVQIEALEDFLLVMAGRKPANTRSTQVQHVLRNAGILGEPRATREEALLDHWRKRGWHPSLEFYLWSRQIPYADQNDPDGQIRDRIIAEYLSEQEPPARITVSGRQHKLTPQPRLPRASLLGELLLKRRTVRRYAEGSVSLNRLSGTLWWGLQRLRRLRNLKRSKGRDYLISYGVALDFYVVVYNVEGLQPGVYFYDVVAHSLTEVFLGDLRSEMEKVMFDMPSPRWANWTIVIVADMWQYQWLYRHDRALRNLYIETGRVGQLLILSALAYSQGSLVTPAVSDGRLSELLRLETPRQAPLYTVTSGRLHRKRAGSVREEA
ncbi:hypothetical protein Ththe16_1972 (plasmid) [Thermus thermophilus SG0.5JP17-16]|uniref:Nitroreductase domain-containing protein n=1 Tax=Thermus thermophilus (strain SG0.5JP17-16) TaxID=762633 RepID=F6DIW6_THETG|nr:SagB/ThcOx family dehydrogenase [Thermus thermophilus]AEG34363.1 hypothetical protein Ththe16_1972 [Thermus thermophilus SG0.5JP17-16]